MKTKLGTRIERAFKFVILGPRIVARYGTLNPRKVRLTGSDNWIHIDPRDARARKKFIYDPLRGRASTPLNFWRAFNAHLRPKLALDVGANFGECLFGLDYNPATHVFGVEASPLIVPCLEKSRSDHPARDRITLFCGLVSDQIADNVPFFVDRNWSGNASAIPALNDVPNVEKFLLPARTLDSILPRELAAGATLLFKMDIEGFESRAFRGFESTLDATSLAVGFVEFDSTFIVTAGESPQDYFAFLGRRFDIYRLTSPKEQQFIRVTAFGELPPSKTGQQRVHTDLLLVTRGASPSAWLSPGWKITR